MCERGRKRRKQKQPRREECERSAHHTKTFHQRTNKIKARKKRPPAIARHRRPPSLARASGAMHRVAAHPYHDVERFSEAVGAGLRHGHVARARRPHERQVGQRVVQRVVPLPVKPHAACCGGAAKEEAEEAAAPQCVCAPNTKDSEQKEKKEQYMNTIIALSQTQNVRRVHTCLLPQFARRRPRARSYRR